MFVDGIWCVKPYREKKVFENYIISIENTDLIIELNETAYTILTIIKKGQCSVITLNSIIEEIQEVFNLNLVTTSELKSDVCEILDFYISCGLLYPAND